LPIFAKLGFRQIFGNLACHYVRFYRPHNPGLTYGVWSIDVEPRVY
jgi:hypothetical protein